MNAFATINVPSPQEKPSQEKPDENPKSNKQPAPLTRRENSQPTNIMLMKLLHLICYFFILLLPISVKAEINNILTKPDLNSEETHLSYKAIKIENNSKYPIQINKIIISDNLIKKIAACSPTDKNCFYKSTCGVGDRIESNNNCLIWIHALRNQKLNMSKEFGTLEIDTQYVNEVNKNNMQPFKIFKAKVTYSQVLYAGGAFTAPGNHIAKWNGESWQRLQNGVGNFVRAMTMMNGDLYVATEDVYGQFLLKWNGQTWSTLSEIPYRRGLAAFDNMIAFNNHLFLGGVFESLDGSRHTLFEWDGKQWSPVTSADSFTDIRALDVINNSIYAGFENENAIARGDAKNWEFIGKKLKELGVVALIHNNNDVYAAGDSGTVYKWNQQKWVRREKQSKVHS